MSKAVSGPVLSSQGAGLLLLCCAFSGLLAGGLRDVSLAAPVLCCAAMTALLGPLPAATLLRSWLFFLGWLALSLCASPEPLMGLAAAARWAVLALWLCSAAAAWGEAEKRRWFWCLGGCGAALALAAFLVDRPGYPYVGALPPYFNYTCFVEAALFAAAFAAVLRQDGPRGPWRWLAAGLGLLAVGEVYWANSRGGLMAAAAGAAVFLWRNLSGRRLRLAVLAAVLAGMAGMGLATRAKLDVARDFKRPQIWRSALAIAAEHPVLGAGPGEFANSFLKHSFPAGYGVGVYRARAEHAHSEVLEVLAELGLPGLLLLLAALWASLRLAPARDSDWTREAGLAAFAAMSCQCLSDNMLQLPGLALLYFSALAVSRTRAGEEPAAAPAWRVLAWAGLACAAVSAAPPILVERLQFSRDPGRVAWAVRLSPADAYLREILYRALVSERPPRTEEALVQLSLAEALSPYNGVYPGEHARRLKAEGRWPAVLELAGKAVSLEPDYLGARLSRAEALLGLGRRDEARTELAEVRRRSAALADQLNGGEGYESFLLAFDRGLFERLARSAGLD